MTTAAERQDGRTAARLPGSPQRICRAAVLRWGGAVMGLPLLLSGCAKKPPPDFAPDPGLVARIRSVRITTPAGVCPGQMIETAYDAVLDDGSEIPFSTRYDKKHPPPLHVIFLTRYSPSAVALENGNWATSDDPLVSAVDGFKLRVILRAKPSVIATTTVAPVYGCGDHAFAFEGQGGGRGGSGGPGPDVAVRLALLSSPFVDRLIVAEVTVEQAPPFYVLADADQVPPADWLIVRSRGGRGGRGANGKEGANGVAGQAGCPGSPGGAGGAGGDGGPGGAGGRGGRVSVFVPDSDPFLAGLVDAQTEGGQGGDGGRAGKGGKGGAGGAVSGDTRRCKAGSSGADGADGRAGRDGPDGERGFRPTVTTLPLVSVFGAQRRPELAALINYHEGARQ